VGAACGIQNLGQNFHILTYTSSSSSAVFQLRLEGSLDGLNFFPVSDDATSQTSGAVYGQGFYPVIRVNLVSYSGTGTISAYYAGTSTGSLPPTGILNQSQTQKKILASVVAGTGTSQGYRLNPPCGGSGGLVWFKYNTAPGASGTITVMVGADLATQNLATFSYSIANNGNQQLFPIPAEPGEFIQVSIVAASGSTYSAQYSFNCPGGLGGYGAGAPQIAGLMQPDTAGAATGNSETTSATNAAVTTTIGGASGQRASLFSASARCTAGTSSLHVSDGGTQIFSTGTAEVGTTTYKFQWLPGLASTLGNNLTITLNSCGSGNTGILDVQASQN
jgi:hypothetical protein